jgi:hypothetical protein
MTETLVGNTKKKEKMAIVNYQCIMCGWPFAWSCGDRTGVGETMHAIESVYYNLNPEAFPRLFGREHISHVHHLHMRNGIDTASAWRCDTHVRNYKGKNRTDIDKQDAYNKERRTEPIAMRIRKKLGNTYEISEGTQEQNLNSLVNNITKQMAWVLESTMGVSASLINVPGDTSRQQRAGVYIPWLKNRISEMSSSRPKMRQLASTCFRDYIHSTCDICNINQTQELKFWRVVSATVGIDNISHTGSTGKTSDIDPANNDPDDITELTREDREADARAKAKRTAKAKKNKRPQPSEESDDENEGREEDNDGGGGEDGYAAHATPQARRVRQTRNNREHVLALILTHTEIEVKKKIYFKYKWPDDNDVDGTHGEHSFEYMSMFINVLTVMNMQTSTMCIQDASAIRTMKNERVKTASYLKRHLWQAGAALLATAILHKSIEIITTLALYSPPGARTTNQQRLTMAKQKFKMTVPLESLWKFVIVECAAKVLDSDATPYSDRVNNLTHSNRAFRVTPYEYMFGEPWSITTFTIVGGAEEYLRSCSNVIAYSMQKISDLMRDERGTSILMLSISRISPGTPRSELIEFTSQIPSRMNMVVSNRAWKVQFQERVKNLHAKMRRCVPSHHLLEAMSTKLIQSPLRDQAPPGLVVQTMLASSYARAVKSMLRLPLILNDMVEDGTRTLVRNYLRRLLCTKNPLVPTR